MEWQTLDALIDEIGGILDAGAPEGWKVFWDKAREIQQGFKSRVRYPTKEDREAAWDRFNGLRDRASEQRTDQKPSAESRKLDEMIDELDSLVNRGTWIFGPLSSRFLKYPLSLNILPPQVYDWRPVWDQAKRIQEAFNGGVRYPTKELREQAWVRFNNLRNEASQRANADRETVFTVSTSWRDFLCSLINDERYHPSYDVVFFFDPTTVEEMKRMGERLRDCGRRLSEAKEYMVREHKDECFQLIQEIRASHDLFWGRYRQELARRQTEYRERIDSTLARIEENISKNEERKSKAEDALARCEANIDKLEDMRDNARSDDFRYQVDEWLNEAREKRQSISESIARAEEWISQDVERRNDIYRKRR